MFERKPWYAKYTYTFLLIIMATTQTLALKVGLFSMAHTSNVPSAGGL